MRAACVAVVVLGMLFGQVGPRLIRALDVTAWPLQVLVVMVAVEVCLLLFDPAIDAWITLVHDRRWGMSTQTLAGFVSDLVKGLCLGLVVNAALLLPLYGLLRTTQWWWLAGWLVTVALTAVFGFLFPVVAAPLFNRFTPLEPGALAERIAAVLERAHLPDLEVSIADESRRSRRDNAYVAGFGATRRLVVFDTMLTHPPELVAQVVAHEIGHWRRRHVIWQVAVLGLCALGVFGLLRAVASWSWLLHRAGVSTLADPGSIPVVLAVSGVAFALTGIVSAAVSRAFERQADLDALELIRDPRAATTMLRTIHVKNLADLDPGRLRRLIASHPPAPERMAMVDIWARHHSSSVSAT